MAVSDLTGMAVVIVVAVIAMTMGLLVLEEITHTTAVCPGGWTNITVNGRDVCVDPTIAYNASNQGEEGIETASGFVPVIAIVVVAAIIIGVVAGSFRGSA